MSERSKRIHIGTIYRINGGRYHARLGKAFELIRDTHGSVTFVHVHLLDGWGGVTKEQDLIPVKYLDI